MARRQRLFDGSAPRIAVALTTAVVLVAPMGMVAATASAPSSGAALSGPADAAAGSVASGLAAAPSTPTVREFDLSELSDLAVSQPARRTAGGTLGSADDPSGLVAVADPKPVSGYGVVGVTWEGTLPGGVGFAVRTRAGDGWSEWQSLHGEDAPCAGCGTEGTASEHGPDAGTDEFSEARPGTDALAVGAVDEVQVRVESPDGELPRDLELAVVDPAPTVTSGDATTTATTTATSETMNARTATVASTSASAAPRPEILTRAQWGADERMRSGSPSYGTIKAGFVHHTVNANNYTREQVPSILRGIYAYHTQSRGWSDIGYNFLVDRFGRIWEGRYGGVARPVIGAHTLNYNGVSFAMSAIGNFDIAEPPAAMVKAYGQLYAWKLGLHGIGAKSTQSLYGKSFAAISGHRDAGSTACPGRYLYAKIPGIRTAAADIQANGGGTVPVPAGPEVARDLDADRLPDLAVRDRATGRLQVLRGTTGPGFADRRTMQVAAGEVDLVAGVGDVTGDGLPDILTRTRATGVSEVRRGREDGLFSRPLATTQTSKFASADLIVGVGDMVGTPYTDVVTRDARTQRLRIYPGKADGVWGRKRLLLEQGGHLDTLTGPGDLNGDGRPDLLAKSSGELLLYPGLGQGQIGSPVMLSTSWDNMELTVAGHDLSGDGEPDLLARDRLGRSWIYTLLPDGRPGVRLGGWKTWADLADLVTVGDPGTGRTRLLGRTDAGTLVVLDSLGIGWFQAPADSGRGISDADFLQIAGDWNGDGHTDVISRSGIDGHVRLHPGTGDGGMGERSRLWSSWTDQRDLVVTADLTGDELPDVIAREVASGTLYVYPSDGTGGSQTRVVARDQLFATDRIVPAGFWNDDNVRDLIVRRTGNQQLYLLPGTATGRLGKPVLLTGDFSAYDQMVGTGDFDRDGRPDLLATEAGTGRLWLFPGTPTGLKTRAYLADGLDGFDLVG